MEDLDALAGNVAFFHVDDTGTGTDDIDDAVDDDATATEGEDGPAVDDHHHHHPIIVTASFDRIRLRERPSMLQDQILKGQVTFTGTMLLTALEQVDTARCRDGGVAVSVVGAVGRLCCC